MPLLLLLIVTFASRLVWAQWSATQCVNYITTCNPIVTASCAYTFCQSCTNLGATAINSCCAENPAPTACLAAIYDSPITSSVIPTSVATLPAACNTVSEYLSICESYTPGFSTLAFSEQAPCLCYSSTVWSPQLYDGYWDTCWTSFSAIDYPGYASVTAMDGPIVFNQCRSAGNVLSEFPTSTAGGAMIGSAACASFDSIYSSCEAQTPGFTNLRDSQAASCLCYTSVNSWSPQRYDSIFGACVAYLSTYEPAAYATLTAYGPPVTTYCQSVGNVIATSGPISTARGSTTQPPVIVVTTTLPGPSTSVRPLPVTKTATGSAAHLTVSIFP
jgi:hypothetical protein